MSTTPIDYAALARQAGAVESTPPKVDYAALAKQAGAVESTTRGVKATEATLPGSTPLLRKLAPIVPPPTQFEQDQKAATARPPGFVERVGAALGIPTTPEEADALKPSLTRTILGPAAMIPGMVKGIAERTMAQEPEFAEAVQNIQKGGPVGANIGKAAYAVEKGTMEGPLAVTGIAPVAQGVGEDVATGNYPGAAGGALGAVAQTFLLHALSPDTLPSTKTRVNKLSYGIGASGEKINYPEAIKTALPELDKAASSMGKPVETVGQLQQVTKEALRRTDNEFNVALHPLAADEVSAHSIANSIRAQAAKLNPKIANEARMRNMLLARASEFEQPWTYGELNQARMNANARLDAFEAAGPNKQMATLRTKADTMIDKAIADGAREIVYDGMQRHYGQDFAGLKQRQSALLDINNRLSNRLNELANETATKEGAPLLADKNVSTYGHPSGGLGISFHRLQDFLIRTTPEGSANRAVKAAYKGLKLEPPALPPTPGAAIVPPQGQLGPGQYNQPSGIVPPAKALPSGQAALPPAGSIQPPPPPVRGALPAASGTPIEPVYEGEYVDTPAPRGPRIARPQPPPPSGPIAMPPPEHPSLPLPRQQALPPARSIQLPNVSDSTMKALSKTRGFTNIPDVMEAAKNGTITPAEASRITKLLGGKAAEVTRRIAKPEPPPQGGHAGGGVASVEELARPGTNYIVSKSGNVTYHGKSFAPEVTPRDGAHVTVLPDGQIRVNAGTLTEAQLSKLKKALAK